MALRHSRTWFIYLLLLVASSVALWLILAVGAERVSLTALQTVEPGSTSHMQRGSLAAMSAAFNNPLSLLLTQVIVIVVCARMCGSLLQRLGQPQVIGEILAGILLGPSLVMAIWPEFGQWLFPAESLPKLQMLSQIGLVLFMFIVGMEVNIGSLRAHAREAVLISHVSVVAPFLLGAALAIALFESYASSKASFLTFGLFMGIAMSVTAFPVLARILMDRGLAKSPLGTLALTCAAVDDVTAWCMLAVIVAIAQAGTAGDAAYIVGLALAYVAVMLWVIKPLLERVIGNTKVDQRLMVIVLMLVLISGLTTELIGLHALFGAFLAGVIIPQREKLRRAVTERVEDVSTLILLPLFFAFTGLRTEVGLLDDVQSWLVCGAIIAVAVAGKLAGCAIMARLSGMRWSDSLALGALMNTRGLMELVVLNLGYDLGILSAKLFTMMVIMAFVTTFMAGPLLNLIDRVRNGSTGIETMPLR